MVNIVAEVISGGYVNLVTVRNQYPVNITVERPKIEMVIGSGGSGSGAGFEINEFDDINARNASTPKRGSIAYVADAFPDRSIDGSYVAYIWVGSDVGWMQLNKSGETIMEGFLTSDGDSILTSDGDIFRVRG